MTTGLLAIKKRIIKTQELVKKPKAEIRGGSRAYFQRGAGEEADQVIYSLL